MRPCVGRIDAVTRSSENLHVDANALADQLFANHIAANMIVVGAAYQHGCLPVSDTAIAEALRLNGTAVDMNLRAFAWGRALVIRPESVAAAIRPAATPPPVPHECREQLATHSITGELADRIAVRFADLVDYQSRTYADHYLGAVIDFDTKARTRIAEKAAALTWAYAQGIYKLMAYKDEYEVARLHLLDAERDRITSEFGDAKVQVLLHPPFLRALGVKHKICLGVSAFLAFRVLRASRRLRGTRADLFGYSHVRRVERQLVDEYRGLMHRAVGGLNHSNYEHVLAAAELPDIVRGYEDVKLHAVERFRGRADELMRAISEGSREEPDVAPVSGTT